MKKMVMLAVLTAGMLLSANAQEVKFGVKAGLNLSTAGGDMKDFIEDIGMDQKSHIGFHIGAFVDLGLTENFYIQPGLFYSNKGLKGELKEDDSYKLKMNLSYLEIPILASYRINLSDNMKWHINAGPYLAYGIGGKIKFEGELLEDEFDDLKAFDEDEGDLKRFDFGLSFGTGVNFKSVYLGVKYDLGLTNIAGDSWEGDEESSSTKIKNRNFSISVGYTF